MIAITPPKIFSQGGGPKQATPLLRQDLLSARNRFRPNFRGWRLDEFSIFARPPPRGASRLRRDERHSIRWTLPGRTTYLPRPRRRRLRRKGGRHAVRCLGLRQTWPPSCARPCHPPVLL